MSRLVLIIVFFLVYLTGVKGQGETKFPKLNYKGYTKSLLIMTNPDNLDFLQTNHLFHNRNQLELRFSKSFSLQCHNRNLIYTGNFLFQPNLARQLEEAATDYLDLTLIPIDRRGVKAIHTLDRLFFEFSKKDWEIRLGRQRINWGVHSIWNPNDIFNSYSFVDFDYEERPGTDGILIKRYLGYTSNIQLAYSPADQWSEATIGAMFQHNYKSFDLQYLLGYDQQNYVVGTGISKNIGEQLLKIESSCFVSEDSTKLEFGLALAYEASTKKGWIYILSYLYDQKQNAQTDNIALLNTNVSARELYPFEHTALITASKSLGPRWVLNFGAAVSFDSSWPVYIFPSASYNIAQNWDLDLFAQVLGQEVESKFKIPFQVLNLRLRVNY